VASASIRATAVESACKLHIVHNETSLRTLLDATVEYMPQNLVQILQQMNLRLRNINECAQNMDLQMQTGFAQTANLRIINRNTRLQAPLEL